ncbi:dinuclear metal center protein, YbgI family [Clostridiales bacterium oral taxon 876 str. F0540]|nr:dinuclear metal center protein, YbgI family [Clostridiales bacterium oral taxon 876 str. F0540]
MRLKVLDVKNIIEKIAPVSLKESYDNVGLMVGNMNDEVSSILVALDCTMDVIEEAISKKCNLVITHHPLLFNKPENITTETLLGRKVIKLIENRINVYSAHTNLDIAKGGLNDIITRVLGYTDWQIIDYVNKGEETYNQGIGRLVILDRPHTLIELCGIIKDKLQIPFVRFSGNDNMIVKKIAVINGSGEDYFKHSVDKGADCIITGDTSYHYVSDYSEMGIGIIDAGHFETEWTPMKIFAEILKDKLDKENYSNTLILSERCKSPYRFA